jgi:hypothetical protein
MKKKSATPSRSSILCMWCEARACKSRNVRTFYFSPFSFFSWGFATLLKNRALLYCSKPKMGTKEAEKKRNAKAPSRFDRTAGRAVGKKGDNGKGGKSDSREFWRKGGPRKVLFFERRGGRFGQNGRSGLKADHKKNPWK